MQPTGLSALGAGNLPPVARNHEAARAARASLRLPPAPTLAVETAPPYGVSRRILLEQISHVFEPPRRPRTGQDARAIQFISNCPQGCTTLSQLSNRHQRLLLGLVRNERPLVVG